MKVKFVSFVHSENGLLLYVEPETDAEAGTERTKMTPERLGEIESAVCSEFRDLDAASEAAEELFSEVRRLQANNAALREDAERYDWLKSNKIALMLDAMSLKLPLTQDWEAALDSAIDAARKGGE